MSGTESPDMLEDTEFPSCPTNKGTSVCSNDLLFAVQRYYGAHMMCQKCAAILLSDGCDPEPARLMKALDDAREAMFKLAGR